MSRYPSHSPLLRIAALSLALPSAAGCGDDEPLDVLPDDAPPATRMLDLEPVCPSDRWIARVLDTDATACPSGLEGWTTVPVFDDAVAPSFELRDDQGLLCLYTLDDGLDEAQVLGAQARMRAAILGGPALEGLPYPLLSAAAPDCVGIMPQTVTPSEEPPVRHSMLADALGPQLRTIFREQIGWVDPALVPAGGAGVTIAVVDTLPYAGSDDPRSEHGPTIVRIIEDLLCTDSDCPFEVMPVLGLPRHADGVDPARGGHFGSFRDVARGVVVAVERWKATSPDDDLVINLSLGWEPELFGGPGSSRPTIQAVETALEYASCHGALIIAATGNDGGQCTEGAMYPAAWESRPAPDASRCAELGAPVPPDSGDAYHPLVHAVGGAHLRFEPMPGTRAHSTPRLVADGTHVVAGADELTPGHTGTSMSTAVVSGIAAAVWSRDPSRPPWEVMELVHASGQPLGFSADLHLEDHGPQPVRRVRMCQALDLAIPEHDYPCSWPSDANLAPVVESALAVDPTPIVHLPDSVDAWAESCDPDAPTPRLALPSPQPNDPACPTCTLADDEVRASLHRNYEELEVEWVVVRVSDGMMSYEYRFEAEHGGEALLTPYDITTFVLGPEVLDIAVTTATISVKLSGLDAPMTNELIVE